MTKPQTESQGQTLDIFLIDTTASTLVVTPEGESVLIDCGLKREEEKDAARIEKVLTEVAGRSCIDHLVITHFHIDHYGAAKLLSQHLEIKNFYDHGEPTELKTKPDQLETTYQEYLETSGCKRHILFPGDELPLKQGKLTMKAVCLSSHSETIPHKGIKNAECEKLKNREDSVGDNSIVLLFQCGDFRFLQTGDLAWSEEAKLVCPTNLVGEIDVFQTSCHGNASSNNPVFLQSIRPSVALMSNIPGKGGHSEVIDRLREVPGFLDIFQQHLPLNTDKEHNLSTEYIANIGPRENCPGHWIHLSLQPDGNRFTVTNSRNNLTRVYPVKSK